MVQALSTMAARRDAREMARARALQIVAETVVARW